MRSIEAQNCFGAASVESRTTRGIYACGRLHCPTALAHRRGYGIQTQDRRSEGMERKKGIEKRRISLRGSLKPAEVLLPEVLMPLGVSHCRSDRRRRRSRRFHLNMAFDIRRKADAAASFPPSVAADCRQPLAQYTTDPPVRRAPTTRPGAMGRYGRQPHQSRALPTAAATFSGATGRQQGCVQTGRRPVTDGTGLPLLWQRFPHKAASLLELA
jgi:hypothetical protein